MANQNSKQIRDVMTANPECVTETGSLRDVARIMKCSIGVPEVDGSNIPTCSYNVLYREGHVPLPPLRDLAGVSQMLPVL